MVRLLNIIIAVALVAGVGWWFLQSNPHVPGAASLPEGVHFGFIRSVDTTSGMIEFDEARMLTGRAAQDAAMAAGLCTEATRSECAPNDYYIDNSSRATVSVPIASDADITLLTFHAETDGIQKRSMRLPEFAELIGDTHQHWNTLPFDITTRSDRVIAVDEVYVP